MTAPKRDQVAKAVQVLLDSAASARTRDDRRRLAAVFSMLGDIASLMARVDRGDMADRKAIRELTAAASLAPMKEISQVLPKQAAAAGDGAGAGEEEALTEMAVKLWGYVPEMLSEEQRAVLRDYIADHKLA